MGNELAARVAALIDEQALLQTGDSIIAAVSGGPDSVAMLHLLFVLSRKRSWRIIVAHMNHGFRGGESDQEEAFVQKLAASLGLAFEAARSDIPAYIAASGMNPQAAAREKRYEFLLHTAQKHGARRIALAHHADDQAETVLMRILRGTSPAGLAGIPMRRKLQDVELIRPVLRIYKSELVRYCAESSLSYCTDSSNLSNKYTRNRIRLELLPELQAYNDRLPEALNRLSEMAAAENEWMNGETRRIFEAFAERFEEGYRLSAAAFQAFPIALQRRLIKLILSYLSGNYDAFDYSKIEELREAAVLRTGNYRLEAGAGILLSREYDTLYVHRIMKPPVYQYPLSWEASQQEIAETGASITLERRTGTAEAGRVGLHQAWFHLPEIAFPLIVRSRKPGDRLDLAGVNGGKKVKDIFIDEKLPSFIRAKIPIIQDASGRILWLPSVRRSRHAVVPPEAKEVLYISANLPFL